MLVRMKLQPYQIALLKPLIAINKSDPVGGAYAPGTGSKGKGYCYELVISSCRSYVSYVSYAVIIMIRQQLGVNYFPGGWQ